VPGDVLKTVSRPETCWEWIRWFRCMGAISSFCAVSRGEGVVRSFLGAVPFSSPQRGTFPLRFVAAHVLQHGAGNNWPRLCARGRAEERFWCWARGKICVLPTIQT